MSESIIQQFKDWVCRKIGHKKETNICEAWNYNGHRYHYCARCGRAVARPFNASEGKP